MANIPGVSNDTFVKLYKDTYGRSYIEEVNQKKVSAIYDFAYGVYRAQSAFYKELNRIISDITKTGKTKTLSGEELDITTYGGQAALSIYQDQLIQARETFAGLAELGLANERRLWQLQ
jgi:hypothetical protein